MILHAFWLTLFSCILNIKCDGHKNPKGSLALDRNLHLAWRVNSTKATIRFTVKATIDKNGWFLVGFSTQENGTKKISFRDVTGDAFVIWKGASKSNHAKSVWRITECRLEKGKLQKDQDHTLHYHLGSSSYDQKTNILTAIVWRPLKTKNSKDVEIKPRSLVVFGSFGNDDDSTLKWKNKMKKLNNGNVEDAFKETENVDFFKSASKSKGGKSNSKKGSDYAAKVAEKHWLGVVVGVSAFLTILITCSVYCITKKKDKEFKRVVSMPFHKNTDYDDEAKVAFLQSEET